MLSVFVYLTFILNLWDSFPEKNLDKQYIKLLEKHNHLCQENVMINIIIVSPVRSTYGGYYGLVVVTPRPRPQTLHRSHHNLKKSLSDCFHILYVDWYRWEDAWEARWARSDYFWATQGPPNSQKCTYLYTVAHIWKTGGYFFPWL